MKKYVNLNLLKHNRFLLQNNLNLFSQWANKWQLNISLSKCAVMTLEKVTPSK